MPEQIVRRIVQLLIGLFLYGIGIAFVVQSALGASPWDVLTQGLSLHFPLTFGTITVILSVFVLILWIPLKQKPGIGTVLNALLVGPSADVGFMVIPKADQLAIQILYIVAGILVVGLATGLYIGSRFGPGPRDGLMTGLHRITGKPIWMARVSIELTVVTLGWVLGGTVGLGTVAFALFIGSACQFFMPLLRVPLVSDIEPNVVAVIPEGSSSSLAEEVPSF